MSIHLSFFFFHFTSDSINILAQYWQLCIIIIWNSFMNILVTNPCIVYTNNPLIQTLFYISGLLELLRPRW